MKKVTVTITSRTVGTTEVYPYERHKGYADLTLYQVPLYEVRVGTSRTYKAVRFGLTPFIFPPPPERICNVGIRGYAEFSPQWVPGYSPHSFTGDGIRGAWRLKPGEQFLIHEGASRDDHTIGASLGCIELYGSTQWNSFMIAIQAETGVSDFSAIGHNELLKVVIEHADFPKAVYTRTYHVAA